MTFLVIEMLKKKGQAFDNKDLETLLIFTPYISAIVKNAGLLTENRDKIERLEHLMGITEYVNSTLELDILLDKMLEASTHMLEAEAGSILLLEKDELVFASATGDQKEKIKNVRVPIGEGIAGWVAREDRSVLVADAQNDPRFFKKADEKTTFKTKSIIAVPLKTKQKLVGVMEVINKKGGDFFNEDDKNLLEALANQAAVAIENAKLYTETQDMFMNTIKCLAETIDKKDNYTRHHSDGVTTYSMEIGSTLGMPDMELKELKIAALFHDIGKIGVDESILRKPAKLTEQEFLEIKKHPDEGANILEPIPQLKDILPVIRHHHERFDGNGYPGGLAGEDIPMHSRIISIADTMDAMLTDRPYRKGFRFRPVFRKYKTARARSLTRYSSGKVSAIKSIFHTRKSKSKRRNTMSAWFHRPKYTIIRNVEKKETKIPEGMWVKCDRCDSIILTKELADNLNVCPKCGLHKRVTAKDRVAMLVDEGTFNIMFEDVQPVDYLNFPQYKDKLEKSKKATGLTESVITGTGKMNGLEVALGVTDFLFMGGSLGSVMGERLTSLCETAISNKLPVIIVSASGGGARMHEGIISLMQMAKISAALSRVSDAGLPFISVMTDPTGGGVTALPCLAI